MACIHCGKEIEHHITRWSPTNAEPKGVVIDTIVRVGRGAFCDPSDPNSRMAEEKS